MTGNERQHDHPAATCICSTTKSQGAFHWEETSCTRGHTYPCVS